jgi:hypothetical protein
VTKGWSKWEKIVGSVLAAVFGLMFINCTGQLWLLQMPYLLVTGWVGFLRRVLPEVTLGWSAIAETVAVGAVLGVGTHLFLRWVWRHLRHEKAVWPVRWSASVVALLVLLFGAAMATVGIGHQVGWLASRRTSLVSSPWNHTFKALGRDNSSLCNEALRWSSSGVSDTKVVQALLRLPETRKEFERLHVVPLRGPDGEPGFLIFPRDTDLREGGGGVRCWEGLEQAETIHATALPQLLQDSQVAADQAP